MIYEEGEKCEVGFDQQPMFKGESQTAASSTADRFTMFAKERGYQQTRASQDAFTVLQASLQLCRSGLNAYF